MQVSGQRQAPAALYTLGMETRSHYAGGLVGPTASLDAEG
jgi:hypothetical protein